MMNGIYDIAVLLCNSQHAFAHHFWNLRGVVRTPTGYTLWCEPVFVIFLQCFPFSSYLHISVPLLVLIQITIISPTQKQVFEVPRIEIFKITILGGVQVFIYLLRFKLYFTARQYY